MANEKRLIDADTALQRLQNALDDCHEFKHSFAYRAVELVAEFLQEIPAVDAVEVEKYKALLEMYHDLRENFIDYVCSGTCNVAPYCLNRCEGCVDKVGWCSQGSDECHGFNPAEVILDGAKMDGDGNA